MIIAEYCEKIGHHELQQLMQKKSAEFYEKNYGISGNVKQIHLIFISSLSSRIESVEFVNRGAAPFIYSGEN